jgi:quinolinate synthase
VEVKAESDILCTSRNAVRIVNSIPAEKPILFLPDINLGNYVKQQSGRENMTIWQGACIVHATFLARRLVTARAEHPNALVAAHPECPADVLAMADFIGSTSAIIDWCVSAPAEEYIVMTESGVRHSLERLQASGKAAVDAAYAAGLANGGADDGRPGQRPQYGRRYYAGYLLDPDRLRVEVVSRR